MGDTMTVTYGAYRIKLTATHLQKGGYKGAFILIDTRGGKTPTATTVEGAGTCSSPEEALRDALKRAIRTIKERESA
jgi:hypothetical protein